MVLLRRANPEQGQTVPEFPSERLSRPSAEVELLEKIVALVVDDDEGGKLFDLDPPDRLHAELGIFQYFDLADAVLGEACGRAPDRAEIEAAVLLPGPPPGRRAVPLAQ